MEPPRKKLKRSVGASRSVALQPFPPELDRSGPHLRLKSRLESIFEKYGRDFSGIGDEVDLGTGKIHVNNGHLSHMHNEVDAEGQTGDEQPTVDSSQPNAKQYSPAASASSQTESVRNPSKHRHQTRPPADPRWQFPELPGDSKSILNLEADEQEDEPLQYGSDRSASPETSVWGTGKGGENGRFGVTYYRRKPSAALVRKPWTTEDDVLLRTLLGEQQIPYEEALPHFPGRSFNSMCQRWRFLRRGAKVGSAFPTGLRYRRSDGVEPPKRLLPDATVAFEDRRIKQRRPPGERRKRKAAKSESTPTQSENPTVPNAACRSEDSKEAEKRPTPSDQMKCQQTAGTNEASDMAIAETTSIAIDPQLLAMTPNEEHVGALVPDIATELSGAEAHKGLEHVTRDRHSSTQEAALQYPPLSGSSSTRKSRRPLIGDPDSSIGEPEGRASIIAKDKPCRVVTLRVTYPPRQTDVPQETEPFKSSIPDTEASDPVETHSPDASRSSQAFRGENAASHHCHSDSIVCSSEDELQEALPVARVVQSSNSTPTSQAVHRTQRQRLALRAQRSCPSKNSRTELLISKAQTPTNTKPAIGLRHLSLSTGNKQDKTVKYAQERGFSGSKRDLVGFATAVAPT